MPMRAAGRATTHCGFEVLRNVTIQRTAEALKEIDRLYKTQRYQEAYGLASRSEQELRRVAALTGEAQI